jgi:hypothetical protein
MAPLFPRRTASRRQRDAALDLMLQARTILGADDDVAVSVSGHDCGDPECGARTVILIMRPDQPTEAIRINKPLEAVTEADLSDALAPFASVSHPTRLQSPPL